MRSVELTFDAAADAAFREAWGALEAADLPNSGRSASESNRPHVTLVAGAALALPTRPAGLVPPPSVLLGGLALFPAGGGRSVLVRAVVVDAALAAFHRDVHALVPGGIEQTRPDRWSPHVTLARRLTPEQVGRAVAVLAEADPSASSGARAEIGGVRSWDGDTREVTSLD